MKRILIPIAMLIVFLPTLTGVALTQEEAKQSPDKTAPAIDLKTLGTPTYSETKNGMQAQIWLVTREEHDRFLSMPKEGKSSKTERDAGTKQSEMNGQSQTSKKSSSSNPEVAIVVLDDTGGKVPIQNAILGITATSPSGKTLTRNLIPAQGHYATDLDFSEKGSYKLSLRVTRDGRTTMIYFETPVLISLN